MQNAMSQLRSDEAGGSTAAMAVDSTALRLAHMQVGHDFVKLRTDAEPILQPEQAALVTPLTKQHTDQLANNAGAV